MSIEKLADRGLESAARLEVPQRDAWTEGRGDGTSLQGFEQPMYLTRQERLELPPLSDETREALKERGYGDKTIEAIGSEAEARIYLEAAIEPAEVNGREVLVRTDIDYGQRDHDGDTNLERMQKGKPPLDRNGDPIELHHVGQKHDAPLAELTEREHHAYPNDAILHDKFKESEIDRDSFPRERREHWKARAAEVEHARQGEQA